MAFIRSRVVRGKKYYQVVRNYREWGKHRQEVLCNLGTHNTLEGAIDHARQEEVALREAATSRRKEAKRRKSYLLQHYDKELGGSIPSYRQASSTWRELEKDLYKEYWRQWYTEQDVRLRWIKWWTQKWELYERILYYHKALGMAERNEQEAEQQLRKLNEFLKVQREYF